MGCRILDYVLKVLFGLHFYQLVMGFVELLKLVLREFLFSFFIFFKGREIRNWSAETHPTSKHFGNGCSKLPVHENPNV